MRALILVAATAAALVAAAWLVNQHRQQHLFDDSDAQED